MPNLLGSFFHALDNLSKRAPAQNETPQSDYGAQFRAEVKQARELAATLGNRAVIHVQTCNDEWVCDACRTIAKQQWTPDTVPALPYAKCTNPRGCRCSIGVEFK